MDRIDAKLNAFFQMTEAPSDDEAFVWRVLHEYERRTRISALAWTAAQAGGATLLLLMSMAAIGSLDADSQTAIAVTLRLLVGFGCVGAAFLYAGRRLFHQDPVPFRM